MRVARNPQNGRFVSLKRKRKLNAIKNLRLKNSTDEDKIKKRKAKVKKAKKTAFKINGNRIIDILYLNEQLIRGCKRCKEALVKATSHSTIFDIPMRPVREDQRHRRRFKALLT